MNLTSVLLKGGFEVQMKKRKNNRASYDERRAKVESARTIRSGQYWWVGGMVRDKRGNLRDALVFAGDEHRANQIAYEKFEPYPQPDIFCTNHKNTARANQEYRMRRSEYHDEPIGETLNRVRHQGQDLDI